MTQVFTGGSALVLRGSASCLALPDDSVDLIVTSPPYFAQRSYRDGDEHYDGQIGDEPTPAEFLDALIACTREWMRVLKPTGSIFVNLGDKYAGSGGYNNSGMSTAGSTLQGTKQQDRGGILVTGEAMLRRGPRSYNRNTSMAMQTRDTDRIIQADFGGVRTKSLLGLPWRYALRCIDELDLILRAELIWWKPNGLPESVTDRVARKHEQWFHLVKSEQYYSAIDEIREPHSTVKPRPQFFPGGTLLDGPSDPPRSLGVGRCEKCDRSVELFALPDEMASDASVKDERSGGADQKRSRRPRSTPIPLFGEGDAELTKDALALVEDADAAVVDEHTEVGGTAATVAEGDAALTVDDASEPREIGLCRRCHPLIVNRRSGANALKGQQTIRERGSSDPDFGNPAGKLPPSVWQIATEALIIDEETRATYDLPEHFAAFPSEWPRRLILGWSPPGICTACGEGRVPVTERSTIGSRTRTDPGNHRGHVPGYEDVNRSEWTEGVTYQIVGWACACTPKVHHRGERGDWKEGREVEPELGNEDWTTAGNGTPRRKPEAVDVPEWQYLLEPATLVVNILGAELRIELAWKPAATEPAVVLDPFSGTGTTAMVARALGRIGIANDLSFDYSRLARWRIFLSGDGAKAVARTLTERQGRLL